MKIDFNASELRLADNSPISLRGARGLRITCTAGTIWITVAGEPGDTFLGTGESHVIEGKGLAIIESIDSGGIRIGKPDKTPAWRSWLARLRRLVADGLPTQPRRAPVLHP